MKKITELINEVLTHVSDAKQRKVYLDRFNAIMAKNASKGYEISDELAIDNYKFARNLIAVKFARYNNLEFSDDWANNYLVMKRTVGNVSVTEPYYLNDMLRDVAQHKEK